MSWVTRQLLSLISITKLKKVAKIIREEKFTEGWKIVGPVRLLSGYISRWTEWGGLLIERCWKAPGRSKPKGWPLFISDLPGKSVLSSYLISNALNVGTYVGVEDRSGIFFPVLELFALQVLPPPSVLERVPSSRARLISQAEESSSFLTQQNLYTGLDPSPAEPDFFLSSWPSFCIFLLPVFIFRWRSARLRFLFALCWRGRLKWHLFGLRRTGETASLQRPAFQGWEE